MITVRNVENQVRLKLEEIDNLLLDWMDAMDMPYGTTISSDVYSARDRYEDSISEFMKELLKQLIERGEDDGNNIEHLSENAAGDGENRYRSQKSEC